MFGLNLISQINFTSLLKPFYIFLRSMNYEHSALWCIVIFEEQINQVSLYTNCLISYNKRRLPKTASFGNWKTFEEGFWDLDTEAVTKVLIKYECVIKLFSKNDNHIWCKNTQTPFQHNMMELLFSMLKVCLFSLPSLIFPTKFNNFVPACPVL